MSALRLEYRHDCQNLGCANTACNLCKLSQRRRCQTNFSSKYLAPCDVVEAKCGAQIYVVVVDEATGQLVQQGLDELAILISIIDGRKYDAEGDSEDVLERCELLCNKQGQPLLAHGRSGSYTDSKRVLVPMIHGQALLPDLKITDSSEALLTGRAPPFRLAVRAVHRSGEPFEGVQYALSEPFVVATARVKGAAKLEIPHVDDHVSKIDCVGLQTQKKLEDIKAAAVAAGVPDLNLPINSVVKVGQFRELVETAERNKALRETLKQVLRLTKGWDIARDHVRKAVETDVQLRVYHPDGRTEVGLVFKCGSFNVIDINRPVGLMRRKQNPQQANQELVDVIWLPLDTASFPDAVKRMLPQASADWRKDSHPGWALLPLTTGHMPPYSEGGKPGSQTSSFTFTVRMGPAPAVPASSAGGAPLNSRSPRGSAPSPAPSGMPTGAGMLPGGVNGFGGPGPVPASAGLPPMGMAGLGGLGGLGMPPPQQALPPGFVPGSGLGGGLDGMRGMQQPGLGPLGGPGPMPGLPGLPPDLMFGQQQAAQPPRGAQQQQFGDGLAGINLDPSTIQGLMQMPTLDLFGPGGPGGASAPPSGGAAAAAAGGPGGPASMRGLGGNLPPELAHLLKDDSLSPFEDPNFQQLMSMVAATQPPGAGEAGAAGGAPHSGRGPAPTSGERRAREKAAKRKADTSLETWMDMSKGLDGLSLPGMGQGAQAPLESLFTSMLPDGGDGAGPPPPPVGFFPAMPSGGGRPDAPRSGRRPVSPRAEAAQAQQLPQPTVSGVEPMDMAQPSESSQQPERGAGATSAPSQQQQQQQQQQQPQQQQPAGAAAMQTEGSQAAAAQAPLVTSVTLEQMQQQFARAMRQEISFGELESFLKQHNLLPSGQPAPGGPSLPMQQQQQANAAAAANGPAPKLQAGSGGLEDMQVIQQALPSASS